MRCILLLFALSFSISLQAQKRLSESPLKGATKIYSLTANQAFELYQNELEKMGDHHFQHLVHTVNPNQTIPPLADGNYLFVQAIGNDLHYELQSVGDLQMKLINNERDLVLVLHHANGKIIENALVELNGKTLAYHSLSKSYRINNASKKAGNLRVEHEKIAYYFPLYNSSQKSGNFFRSVANAFPLKYITRAFQKTKKPYYGRDYFHGRTIHEGKFQGFLTTNKPIYKPGDTVKLKAFVMNRSGKGLEEKLIVRISNPGLSIDTIIGTVSPYRPGGYSFEFVLSDSLDLDLDEDYLLALETLNSRKYDLDKYEGELSDDEYAFQRKTVIRGRFHYEEYELRSIRFLSRSDKSQHNRGEPVSIFLKAVDENDLPLYDGRVEMVMFTRNGYETEFHSDQVFLPDTLWKNNVLLESIGETRVILPDSIFPHASFGYEIHSVLLASNNERQTSRLYGKFNNSPQKFRFNLTNDSLLIEKIVNGKSVNSPAVVSGYSNEDHAVDSNLVQLPARIRINPFVGFYKIISGELNSKYELAREKRQVSALSSRTHDSLFIELSNPQQLPYGIPCLQAKNR
jgi:alpha-2-macroglobulin